jgi:small redox-active disulfide protein 2
VLGTGCTKCKLLESAVLQAVNELGLDIEVVKIDDFEQIIRRGLMMTPGLIIDDEIVAAGRVPSVEEIIDMINSKVGDEITSLDAMINVINPECGCSTKGTMIYPCSGGSNVGQISNEAAKALVGRKVGKFSCLAGVGSHGEGFISSAKKAGKIVVIDGCATRCAFKILQQAGIEPTVHLVVTDLGIKKDYEQLDPRQEDIDKMIRELESKL